MSPPVDPADHLDWAAGIARGLARNYRLRHQEAEDLVSEAHAKLCECAARPAAAGGFSPLRAVDAADLAVSFRVWAYLSVWKACDREAQRLRGGGLFRTIRPALLFTVGALGDSAELVAADPEPLPPPRPPAEPAPADRPRTARIAGLTISGPTAERLARLLTGPRDFRAKARPATPTLRRPVAALAAGTLPSAGAPAVEPLEGVA